MKRFQEVMYTCKHHRSFEMLPAGVFLRDAGAERPSPDSNFGSLCRAGSARQARTGRLCTSGRPRSHGRRFRSRGRPNRGRSLMVSCDRQILSERRLRRRGALVSVLSRRTPARFCSRHRRRAGVGGRTHRRTGWRPAQGCACRAFGRWMACGPRYDGSRAVAGNRVCTRPGCGCSVLFGRLCRHHRARTGRIRGRPCRRRDDRRAAGARTASSIAGFVSRRARTVVPRLATHDDPGTCDDRDAFARALRHAAVPVQTFTDGGTHMGEIVHLHTRGSALRTAFDSWLKNVVHL